MRLWTIHPKYLDCKGLLAVWREGLLAKKVLEGKTRRYKHHPQLARFMAQKNPVGSVNAYLFYIVKEADRRGYCFNKKKIGDMDKTRIKVSKKEIAFEFEHLKKKLRKRNRPGYKWLTAVKKIEPHPLFRAF